MDVPESEAAAGTRWEVGSVVVLSGVGLSGAGGAGAGDDMAAAFVESRTPPQK